jgi:hypothetical protein
MNIIKHCITQIELQCHGNAKISFKNYATEAAAEKATAKAARNMANYFTRVGVPNSSQPVPKSANYVVVYIESRGRWVGCIDLTGLLNRPNAIGGYLGVEPGFFRF